jgi:serine/threonine-protein kinase HipA
MNRCPITYETCGEQRYSKTGLQLLSPRLQSLKEFPLRKDEQLALALQYADKLSFSGVQKKLSARLSVSREVFDVVAKGGSFIIKPQSADYPELPQNEDLTMKLAACVGINTPIHGMMYCSDGSLSYFIKRFDRKGKGKKIGVEDFAQLAGLSRDTKYDFSMERLVPLIEKFCTFPALEKKKLFLLTLFSFLIGNEDLHLKNFSLIHQEQLIEFSPAYDLVNSSIVINSNEEFALTLRGRKSNLTRTDLVDYFGKERLNLTPETINEILDRLQNSIGKWMELINISFLSKEKKAAYLELLLERRKRLFLNSDIRIS